MEITVQMLGTGSAFAKTNYNNNALIHAGGFTLLVDCGITAPLSLHKLGLNPSAIDGILITHMHADHTGGLEEIGFISKFKYNRKPRLFLPPLLREPLWQHSLRGGMESQADGWTSIDDFFEVTELEEKKPFELAPGFTVEPFRTQHVPGKPSYALLFSDLLFYSGDTQFNPELLDYMVNERKVPYLLHECSFSHPAIIHTSLNELLTLPEAVQERVLLMHYEDTRPQYEGKTGKMSFLEQHIKYRFTPQTKSRLA